MVEMFASLASKLEETKKDPPKAKEPPSISDAVHNFGGPQTSLHQPVTFPPPPGFPVQPQYGFAPSVEFIPQSTQQGVPTPPVAAGPTLGHSYGE